MAIYHIKQLCDQPIEAVAQRLRLNVVKHFALCPFHDDHHPSLYLNPKSNRFRCFSCGAHGDALDLTIKLLGCDLKGACQWLSTGSTLAVDEAPATPTSATPKNATPTAEKGGYHFDAQRYQRYFEHPWLSDAARRFLFHERRLHSGVVSWCRLTSYADWLQIPYYAISGQLVGVQRRYLGSDPKQPRFRFLKGADCHLYNLPVIQRLTPGEPLFIAEGPSDTWALLSSGRKAIGVPSATLLKVGDFEAIAPLLQSFRTPLHLYPDGDRAGEKLYRALLTVANGLGLCLVKHELPAGCKDFSDLWRQPHLAQALPVTRNLLKN